MKRKIVKINEDLCNGCGACVTPCAEGAIQLVGGKAKVVRDELCDGAGFCLGVCPTGALTIEEREAPAFDPQAAHAEQARRGKRLLAEACFRCGTGEEEAVLFPCRHQGKSQWVCVRCLPPLIHG
ncbi:MAG: ferredoxin [Planctomycetes bacterium]|nr:ferredoxin [Planctomycetota bacterium]